MVELVAASAGGTRRRGRPRKTFGPSDLISVLDALERLRAFGFTLGETAAFFQVTEPTLRARFREFSAMREAWRRGRGIADISLRRRLRIPTKPATHSNRKPATDSDLKPAGIPI